MKKIKVAIIIPSLWVGGAENMAAQLACNINRDLFDVLLIVLSNKMNTSINEYVENENINVKYLNKKQGKYYGTIKKLYSVLDEFKPQIVHTHLESFMYSFLWVISHKVKMIHTIHNVPRLELSKKGQCVISTLYKLKKAIPVAISDIIKQQTEELYGCKYIETIYNPVDVKRYHIKRKMNKNDEITFVSVGRLVEQKNQKLLINAFYNVVKKFPKLKLKIIGDGNLRESLEKQVNKLEIDDKVSFLGNIKNVEHELEIADIFILSSEYEGLPLSILEAMASSLPIISTNVGGVSNIVTNNGILVEKNNQIELENAMIKLCENHEERFLLGQNSYENVLEFDVKNITQQYERVYKKYISGELNA